MKRDDERAESRPERVPLYKQQTFTAQQKSGYLRRWVNDLPGRIDSFKKAGWTLVVDDLEKTHDGLAQVESQLGSGVRRVVNKTLDAPCRYSVLMEIPTEWYEADKKEQQKLIDDKEAAFDQSGIHKSTGMYGSMRRENGTKS